MANTYTQISIHAVFSVKGRENFITQAWRERLHTYIAGIIRTDAKLLAVGGWKDHVHVFYGLDPAISISDMMQKIKTNSSKWINENGFVKGKFRWQEGYAAFSYARSQRNTVIKYILNQEEHHKVKSFKTEYLEMLKKFDVDYDERYVFEFYDQIS